nr:hypothetical protein [Escherichia coli]
MDHEKVAASLAELGNSHRLSVFRFLVKAGHDGGFGRRYPEGAGYSCFDAITSPCAHGQGRADPAGET